MHSTWAPHVCSGLDSAYFSSPLRILSFLLRKATLAPLGVCGHTDGRGKEEARGERGTESDATSGPDRVSESEDAAALRAPGHEMKRLYMYEHYILRCKMSTRLGAISPAPYESGGRAGSRNLVFIHS